MKSLLQTSVPHDPSEIILKSWLAAQLLSTIIGVQLLLIVLIINAFVCCLTILDG